MDFMQNHGQATRKFGEPGEPMELPAAEEQEALPPEEREPVDDKPCFLLLTDVKGEDFAGQWLPTMPMVDYIGTTQMLLSYIHELEARHHLTMPIKACGIDPILFANVENAMPDAPTTIFTIKTESEGEETTAAYELINVDGDNYLSCISNCVDREYLNGIIADATASVRETRNYVFQMVGYRKLALEEGQTTARLINTLRLNTYEMSALVSYMQNFQGMQVTYDTINGHQCICFRV